MSHSRDAEFEEFVRSRRRGLLRSASILAAGDVHLAEDLVQGCLTKLYVAWPRARRLNLDAYVRRMLVNALVDEKRRPAVKRERATDEPPERPVVESVSTSVQDTEMLAALAGLPAGMRAAVVLRHVDGLSVEETAAALRCSGGTVKSQTARGLTKLREVLATAPEHDSTEGTQRWTA